MSDILILPGNPLFDLTLALPDFRFAVTLAEDCGSNTWVARQGTGILEPVTTRDLDEYLLGGEYDSRLEEIGESLDD